MSTPQEAVFLGIDSAKHLSGACILTPDYGVMDGPELPFSGGYATLEFGKVVSQSERERFLESFVQEAKALHLPAVVVAEVWDPPHDKRVRLPGGSWGFIRDQKWTYETILGIGEGWGRWSAEIERVQEALSYEILLTRVTPNTWRDALFTKRRARDTEALKETACRYFEGVFGYAVSDDVAEAGCIALWGTVADEVETLISSWQHKPVRRKKAS